MISNFCFPVLCRSHYRRFLLLFYTDKRWVCNHFMMHAFVFSHLKKKEEKLSFFFFGVAVGFLLSISWRCHKLLCFSFKTSWALFFTWLAMHKHLLFWHFSFLSGVSSKIIQFPWFFSSMILLIIFFMFLHVNYCD